MENWLTNLSTIGPATKAVSKQKNATMSNTSATW